MVALITIYITKSVCVCQDRIPLHLTSRTNGSKVRANASKHKAISYERMCAKEQQLEAEVSLDQLHDGDGIKKVETNKALLSLG